MLLPPTSTSSGRGGSVTRLSSTSCPDTMSDISCLNPPQIQPTTYSNLVSYYTSFHLTNRSQAHTQLLPKQISTKCTEPDSYFKINSIISPSTHPPNHPYQSPCIAPSTHPTPTPSHTWAIPGRLGQPHGSHFTRIQGWIPLPGPVLDTVVYPVMRRGSEEIINPLTNIAFYHFHCS